MHIIYKWLWLYWKSSKILFLDLLYWPGMLLKSLESISLSLRWRDIKDRRQCIVLMGKIGGHRVTASEATASSNHSWAPSHLFYFHLLHTLPRGPHNDQSRLNLLFPKICLHMLSPLQDKKKKQIHKDAIHILFCIALLSL